MFLMFQNSTKSCLKFGEHYLVFNLESVQALKLELIPGWQRSSVRER